jgi:hypothetical protein
MRDNTKRGQLTDRDFFDAHLDQNTRRRPIIPGEVQRSLAGRDMRRGRSSQFFARHSLAEIHFCGRRLARDVAGIR